MVVANSANQAEQKTRTFGTRVPGFDLTTCIEVPRVLHSKAGGQATSEQLAAHLGYKGTNNGSYLTKVGATTLFGLIAKNGPVYIPTALAHSILSPTYTHEQKKALVEAFFSVPIFKKIYEDFKGKELPPEFGMKNALRLTYGVKPNKIAEAYRCLMSSAETAGFFDTKAGVKTHLILPLTQPVPGAAVVTPPAGTNPAHGGGGGTGGGDGGGSGEKPPIAQDAKAQYLATLIKLFEKKAGDGDIDEKLMERIERLIGLSAA